MAVKISRRWLLLCGLLASGGCSAWKGWSMRSQSPEASDNDVGKPQLVGDLAVADGMKPVVIEFVGLVTGLRGTGSDPKPSPERALLLSEMQIRDVKSPNAILASGNTSLVKVRGYLRPGIQKNDPFDVEVRVPSGSETTSLRGGFLLATPLKSLAVMKDGQFHSSDAMGIAEGAVLVDPSANPKTDRVLATRGRILGGGRAKQSRQLRLILKPEQQSVFHSARIQEAINKRFFVFDKAGSKTGVGTAKTDQYIELKLHPRYKDNVHRFIAVIRSLPLRESETERQERLKLLGKQLLDPISSSRAALQLEAIGKPGVEILAKGMQSTDPEVRFYSAEALAYLDETRAAEPLGAIARTEPAFRVFALTALSAMEDYAAADQLRQLLHMPSAETRYGAFRALWAMNPREPALGEQKLSSQFALHIVDTSAPPMIHVTRSRRAEIVLFGRDQYFTPPINLEAGNRIMLTSHNPDEIVISKFAPNEADQKRTVSTRVEDVIRGIVDLGGAYPDVVQALQQAKACGALACRFEVDALPEAGRLYERTAKAKPEAGKQKGAKAAEGKTEESESADATPVSNSPMPDLFSKPSESSHLNEESDKSVQVDEKDEDSEKKKTGPVRSFFARMRGSNAG